MALWEDRVFILAHDATVRVFTLTGQQRQVWSICGKQDAGRAAASDCLLYVSHKEGVEVYSHDGERRFGFPMLDAWSLAVVRDELYVNSRFVNVFAAADGTFLRCSVRVHQAGLRTLEHSDVTSKLVGLSARACGRKA